MLLLLASARRHSTRSKSPIAAKKNTLKIITSVTPTWMNARTSTPTPLPLVLRPPSYGLRIFLSRIRDFPYRRILSMILNPNFRSVPSDVQCALLYQAYAAHIHDGSVTSRVYRGKRWASPCFGVLTMSSKLGDALVHPADVGTPMTHRLRQTSVNKYPILNVRGACRCTITKVQGNGCKSQKLIGSR